MKKIAFVTSSEDPRMTSDDLLTVDPLRRRGILVEPWVWDSDAAPPAGIAAAVFRSCWNYHLKGTEFSEWISSLDGIGFPLRNPLSILGWNLHKKYLLELGDRGIPIPKTAWVERSGGKSADRELDEAILSLSGFAAELVVKPAVSANGYKTRLIRGHDQVGLRAALADVFESGDAIVQEFVDEIRTEGEISLMFMDGRFSHAIRKLPSASEFRVQVEHGGTRQIVMPSAEVLAQAERAIRELPGEPLYARIDGVESGGRFVLMEVEAIDPMLFLGYGSGAPERFADAIARWLEREPRR